MGPVFKAGLALPPRANPLGVNLTPRRATSARSSSEDAFTPFNDHLKLAPHALVPFGRHAQILRIATDAANPPH
jgi:hypothetical protein